MASKEAFLKIESFCAYYSDEVGDALSVIAKDLEVLEILKKHLHIRNGTWSNIITCNIDSLTNENYEILEEWLNEK